MLKNKNLYKKVFNELKKNNNFLIASHINPDGDSICSSMLMATLLRDFDKRYHIIIEDPFPERYRFILSHYYKVVVPELINVPKGVDLLTQLPEDYFPDVILIIDSGGTDRLGDYSKYFKRAKKIINIDHHAGHLSFKALNLLDPDASSSGEILYDLMEANHYKFGKDLAILIYTAIVTDTRFFTQANTTSRTHYIVSRLIEKGVVPENIAYQLEQVPPDTLKVFGKVLTRSKTDFDGELIYSYITKPELKACRSRDIDGLVELLRGTTETKVALLFKELDGKVKVSMRGKNHFNVFKMARQFDGGGHIQAAGCTVDGNLSRVIKIVLDKFKIILKHG
ncbi:MAG: bifunctional oligoribonuclease/PAP phosphatase NrnA [Spirochaetes bacterium]|nr:bifunctional oligoribonuclease/PAP phosphatase NrnA [Spirochaetota bacterium]